MDGARSSACFTPRMELHTTAVVKSEHKKRKKEDKKQRKKDKKRKKEHKKHKKRAHSSSSSSDQDGAGPVKLSNFFDGATPATLCVCMYSSACTLQQQPALCVCEYCVT